MKFTVGRVTSADHGREDFWGVCGSTIGGVAISVGDYGDFNAAELVGDDTTGLDYIVANKDRSIR